MSFSFSRVVSVEVTDMARVTSITAGEMRTTIIIGDKYGQPIARLIVEDSVHEACAVISTPIADRGDAA